MKTKLAILSLFASSSVFAATVNLVNGGFVTDREGNVITCTSNNANQSKCVCLEGNGGWNDLVLIQGQTQLTLAKQVHPSTCPTLITTRPECK